MAGGAGTRFWPQSKSNKPKQFLDILETGKSLIQDTVQRFASFLPLEQIYIITNQQYKDLCLEQLPELASEQIICEPSRNNTAPCIAYSTYKIFAKNKNAKVAVVPADHLIRNTSAFIEAMQLGLNFAQQQDVIVTLGIEPSRPDTGYGYIQFGEQTKENIFNVVRFVEKPNLEKANEYLISKDYLWNAGIFIASAQTLIDAYQKFVPEMHQLFINGATHYNTVSEKQFIDTYYPKTQNISFDYAIAEKAQNVFTIPVNCGWSDLGTWASLYDVLDKDVNNNACNSKKNMLLNASNNMIQVSKNKDVVIKGLENFIIVENENTLLIYPKDLEQEIKQISTQFS